MSPIVRGRAIEQIESSGHAKSSFDILLWTGALSQTGVRVLDSLQMLREYLGCLHANPIEINVWLPDNFREMHLLLNAYAIPTSPVKAAVPDDIVINALGKLATPEMQSAAATALSCNADIVVTEDTTWLPFVEEFEQLNTLLGSPEIIRRQAEIFVCGHDLPWSFNHPIFDAPWGPFYFLAENQTLAPGQAFLEVCAAKHIDQEAQEVGRSLVYNRIPNILFTRDRLLFYEMQRTAAKRAKWERQNFQFEIGYHLNFYYILLFGAFDHLAVLLNGVLGLGVKPRDVYARGAEFLARLNDKAPELHAMFTDPEITDFMDRVGSIRHSSAHKSQIMLSPVYEAPEHESTVEELDAEIREKGLDSTLRFFPEGRIRDAIRESIRFRVKISKYKVLLEDAVFIDTRKKKGFINPLLDTEWNFRKFYGFVSAVLRAAVKRV